MRLLVLKPLGHAELTVLRVAQFAPQHPAALAQPRIELDERAEAQQPRLLPDAAPAVLHILLDHAFLPTGSDIAEIGVEQIVGTHHRKAGVDHTTLTLLHLVTAVFMLS